MRRLLFIVFLFAMFNCSGQNQYLDKYEQDTLQLPAVHLNQIIALRTGDAVIGLDRKVFIKYLSAERKGTQKQIKERMKLKSQGLEIDKIVAYQTSILSKQLTALDSVNFLVSMSKSDTTFIDYQIIYDGGNTAFGDFLPAMIEGGMCLIFDKQMKLQSYIIRQKGWRKTGPITSSGSTHYLLSGSTRYFWSRWDFST